MALGKSYIVKLLQHIPNCIQIIRNDICNLDYTQDIAILKSDLDGCLLFLQSM